MILHDLLDLSKNEEHNTYFVSYLRGGSDEEINGNKAKKVVTNVLEAEQ